jgi:hypothetical protein
MKLSAVNARLQDVVSVLTEGPVMSNKRRVKPSEVDMEPYSSGAIKEGLKVSYKGKLIGILVYEKKGWKGASQYTSTKFYKGEDGWTKALVELMKESPVAFTKA